MHPGFDFLKTAPVTDFSQRPTKVPVRLRGSPSGEGAPQKRNVEAPPVERHHEGVIADEARELVKILPLLKKDRVFAIVKTDQGDLRGCIEPRRLDIQVDAPLPEAGIDSPHFGVAQTVACEIGAIGSNIPTGGLDGPPERSGAVGAQMIESLGIDMVPVEDAIPPEPPLGAWANSPGEAERRSERIQARRRGELHSHHLRPESLILALVFD